MYIPEIEKISITILMDNSTDLLLKNSAHAIRNPLITEDKLNLPPPVAEHGFSALVSITTMDNIQNRYLFDTGVTENGVIHNADLLGVDHASAFLYSSSNDLTTIQINISVQATRSELKK